MARFKIGSKHPLRMASRACVATAVLILAAAGEAAETEIHRCLLEDDTFAFQETPCPRSDANDDKDDESPGDDSREDNGEDGFAFTNPFDEPATAPTPAESTLPEATSRNRAECESTTRDAIDTIDLEMRQNAYTKDQGKEYLAELLVLTRQLRACGQL